ncbi:MAG: phosphoribosylglycinamide formyltransferase [Promethearchaeota archaeon]
MGMSSDRDVRKVVNIGIIASGSGSNAEAIMNACEDKNGLLYNKARVVVLISNRKGAYCLERAKKHNIPAVLIESDGFKGTREEYDELLINELKKYDVELVCLAGYMRIVTLRFLKAFPNRVMNIHPALLPSFPGLHGYRDAVEYGVKVTGCTVHFVDEKVDHGPIIIQKCVNVNFEDTEESLKERGLKVEHQAYPEAISLYCDGRLEIVGRKVKIKRID